MTPLRRGAATSILLTTASAHNPASLTPEAYAVGEEGPASRGRVPLADECFRDPEPSDRTSPMATFRSSRTSSTAATVGDQCSVAEAVAGREAAERWKRPRRPRQPDARDSREASIGAYRLRRSCPWRSDRRTALTGAVSSPSRAARKGPPPLPAAGRPARIRQDAVGPLFFTGINAGVWG